MNPLSSKAMLVRMSIHSWYGKKIDRNAARVAATSMNVEVGSDEYYKYLIPKNALLGLMRHHANIREYHTSMTFPWFDDGLRVLPSHAYFKYCQRIHLLRDHQQDLVSVLIDEFPTYIHYARHSRGPLFNEKDYPSVDELREMFRVDLAFLPFPEADDFRVSLDAETMLQLRESIQAEQVRVVENNIKSLTTTLRLKLTAYIAMCSGGRVLEATVQGLRDAMEMTENLNITKETHLDTLVLKYRMTLENVTAHDLRHNAQIRAVALFSATNLKGLLDDNSRSDGSRSNQSGHFALLLRRTGASSSVGR